MCEIAGNRMSGMISTMLLYKCQHVESMYQIDLCWFAMINRKSHACLKHILERIAKSFSLQHIIICRTSHFFIANCQRNCTYRICGTPGYIACVITGVCLDIGLQIYTSLYRIAHRSRHCLFIDRITCLHNCSNVSLSLYCCSLFGLVASVLISQHLFKCLSHMFN